MILLAESCPVCARPWTRRMWRFHGRYWVHEPKLSNSDVCHVVIDVGVGKVIPQHHDVGDVVAVLRQGGVVPDGGPGGQVAVGVIRQRGQGDSSTLPLSISAGSQAVKLSHLC